jgi:fructose-1,6-bisphosphatase/inositol monophosphatase family enzyme
VKLEADRLCEQAIVETIRRDWPEHPVLTEESGALDGNGDYWWLIDPLDGTVNFFYGLPYFCTSVACYRRPTEQETGYPRSLASLGEPLVGAVYAPPTDELFVGQAGKGAELNGERIRASAIDRLEESLVTMGFAGRPGLSSHFREQAARLEPRVRKLRCMGAAAYDLCNVACGRLTGFYEKGLHAWDFGAAQVILAEAGAVLDTFEYEQGAWNLIAAAPGIVDEFRRILRG